MWLCFFVAVAHSTLPLLPLPLPLRPYHYYHCGHGSIAMITRLLPYCCLGLRCCRCSLPLPLSLSRLPAPPTGHTFTHAICVASHLHLRLHLRSVSVASTTGLRLHRFFGLGRPWCVLVCRCVGEGEGEGESVCVWCVPGLVGFHVSVFPPPIRSCSPSRPRPIRSDASAAAPLPLTAFLLPYPLYSSHADQVITY